MFFFEIQLNFKCISETPNASARGLTIIIPGETWGNTLKKHFSKIPIRLSRGCEKLNLGKYKKNMAKKKEWSEGEIVLAFQLKQIIEPLTATMQEWLAVEKPVFSVVEQANFDDAYEDGRLHIKNWSEEDLKMKFISHILKLGNLVSDKNFVSFFDKKLAAQVQNYQLSVKADFVIAKGIMDFMEKPYFHFQEYKPNKKPTGDSMAQLLEAFLIAQKINNDNKALYGCEVNGANWVFITMENNAYCISKIFDSTDKEDLMQIIAILRKFRHILETVLLI